MTIVQTFESQIISALKNRSLSDADFYHRLAAVMAEACQADERWLLLIDANGIKVLSENEEDLRRFHRVSATDQEFNGTLQLALQGQQVRTLTLAPTPNLATQFDAAKTSVSPVDRCASLSPLPRS